MAERGGFEPPKQGSPTYLISSQALSTAQPPLRLPTNVCQVAAKVNKEDVLRREQDEGWAFIRAQDEYY